MQDTNESCNTELQGYFLLTAQDVAKSLHVSEAMAYLLMQRKQIATVKIGRSVRVRPIDLEKFISGSISL